MAGQAPCRGLLLLYTQQYTMQQILQLLQPHNRSRRAVRALVGESTTRTRARKLTCFLCFCPPPLLALFFPPFLVILSFGLEDAYMPTPMPMLQKGECATHAAMLSSLNE